MIEAKTVLHQVAIPNARNVVGDFVRLLIENGVVIETSKSAHTVCVMPDDDLATIFEAVNADITTRPELRWPAIDKEEWARLEQYCEITHTKAVRASYAQFKLEMIQNRIAQIDKEHEIALSQAADPKYIEELAAARVAIVQAEAAQQEKIKTLQ